MLGSLILEFGRNFSVGEIKVQELRFHVAVG